MTTATNIRTAAQVLAAGDGLGRCELVKGALKMMLLRKTQALAGGDVLGGFNLAVSELFK